MGLHLGQLLILGIVRGRDGILRFWPHAGITKSAIIKNMQAIIVFAILLLSLFALVYLTKRRFGVLGLALCAGSLLSASWTDILTALAQKHGLVLVSPPLASVIAALLIVLPSLLLLFSGPSYTSPLARLGGALSFALLAFVFLLGPLQTAIAPDHHFYEIVERLKNLIIVGGIMLALVDVLLMHSGHVQKKR